MIGEETESAKYIKGLELLIRLEGKIVHGFAPEEIKSWEPQRLYWQLWQEWWYDWNGLLQEWEPWQE